MSRLRVTPILLFWCITIFSCNTTEQRSSKLQFTDTIQDDATAAVLSNVLKLKNNNVIEFENGIYHFYPDKAQEYFVHISNHNDEVIRTAFPLKGLKDIVIDGKGSTFIFHGRMIPFLIDDCQNIIIKNITIDWHTPFHSEGTVTKVNEKERTFDLKISEEYPYVIRNNQIYFEKEYYEHSAGQAILYDTKRNAIAFGTEFCTPLTTKQKAKQTFNLNRIKYKYEIDPRDPKEGINRTEASLHFKELAPGLVRIFNHRKDLPAKGTKLIMKGDQSENRLAPAIRVNHCKDFFAENITINHAGGMGLIAENSENLYLHKFNVIPSHGRMVSTTADATHFVGCRGFIHIQNCIFNNQLDDACNVHGTYQKVMERINDKTLGIRLGHYQQLGFKIGNVQDTIGFVRLSNSFLPKHTATIKQIETINSRYQIMHFNESLPENIKEGDLIENLSAYPKLLIENCTISRNRARGLLLSTPKRIEVKDNFFSTEMEAILIPVESNHWYESGIAQDLLIQNNTFTDCNHSGLNRGIIRLVTDDCNNNTAFKNILIKDNKFNQFDNLILEIANTEGLVFEDNTINKTTMFPALYPENPVVKIKSSKDIQFSNNRYKGKAKTMIIVEGDMNPIEFH